jgi:hypothetical protein
MKFCDTCDEVCPCASLCYFDAIGAAHCTPRSCHMPRCLCVAPATPLRQSIRSVTEQDDYEPSGIWLAHPTNAVTGNAFVGLCDCSACGTNYDDHPFYSCQICKPEYRMWWNIEVWAGVKTGISQCSGVWFKTSGERLPLCLGNYVLHPLLHSVREVLHGTFAFAHSQPQH